MLVRVIPEVENAVLQYGHFTARILAVLGAVLCVVLGAASIVAPSDLTHFFLGFPIVGLGILVAMLEGSPELAPVVLAKLPDMARLRWRGCFYIFAGLLPEGCSWSSSIGMACGVSLQAGGAILVYTSHLNRKRGLATSAEITSALTRMTETPAGQSDDPAINPTSFFRYNDGTGDAEETLVSAAPYTAV